MKVLSILTTSVVLLFAATLVTAAEKPAKPAAPPKEKETPAKPAPAKLAPAAKGDSAKPAPAKPEPAKPDPSKPESEPAKPGKADPAAGFEIKDPLAVIDGQEIKIAEVDAVLTGLLRRERKTLADVPPEQKAYIYRSIVDDMVVEKIISKRSADEKVTDEEVATVIDGFKAKAGSEEELKKQIEASGQTVEGVQKNIRQQLKAQHWVDAQIAGKIEVADTEAEDFYKSNPEQFQMPERVRASHILIAAKEEGGDDAAAKKKAAAVLARVKKGEDFAKLADELSEDPSAKQNHGDLDFFERERMVPEFSDAAFKLKKGDVATEPVRSKFGYHIIKVTDRKDAGKIELDEAKPKIFAFLKTQKRDTELMKLAKELRDKAVVKINLPELPKNPTGAPPEADEDPASPAPAPVKPAK